MYHNGRGVLHDSVYAHMWWNIGASEGHENAKRARDTIVQDMTQTQIAEAIRLARECVAKGYKGC